MIKKILKWTGFILLFIIVGTLVTMLFRQHLKYEAPYPAIKASKEMAVIERGKQVALVTAGCVHCHQPVQNVDSLMKIVKEPALKGGAKFATPFGTFYTPNITPGKTGIGNYSDGEIARVLRYGVKKNGEAVLPFMNFSKMSDDDITAVISYLRSQQPVENNIPKHEFNLVGMFMKAFMVKPVIPEKPALVAQAR
jgi:cytochrome c553